MHHCKGRAGDTKKNYSFTTDDTDEAQQQRQVFVCVVCGKRVFPTSRSLAAGRQRVGLRMIHNGASITVRQRRSHV
jgi:hypothetical protein